MEKSRSKARNVFTGTAIIVLIVVIIFILQRLFNDSKNHLKVIEACIHDSLEPYTFEFEYFHEIIKEDDQEKYRVEVNVKDQTGRPVFLDEFLITDNEIAVYAEAWELKDINGDGYLDIICLKKIEDGDSYYVGWVFVPDELTFYNIYMDSLANPVFSENKDKVLVLSERYDKQHKAIYRTREQLLDARLWLLSYEIQTSVCDGLEDLVFTFEHIGDPLRLPSDSEKIPIGLTIRDLQKNKIQELNFEVAEYLRTYGWQIVDFNFDGYADILILNEVAGKAVTFYTGFLYNPQTGLFEEVNLDGIYNLAVNQEERVLKTVMAHGAGWHTYSIYEYHVSEFVKTRELSVEYVPEYEDIVYIEHQLIENEWVKTAEYPEHEFEQLEEAVIEGLLSPYHNVYDSDYGRSLN